MRGERIRRKIRKEGGEESRLKKERRGRKREGRVCVKTKGEGRKGGDGGLMKNEDERRGEKRG